MNNREIREFYRLYPYPRVDALEYDLNLLDHMHYLAGTCGRHTAPRKGSSRGRVLVAGAGTREAVTWALSLPNHQIDAVDLSEASLAIAYTLAQQLGVDDRIRFLVGDFEKGEGLRGPYDFISSFGVLHHLHDPAAGLAQLEQHLAPGGLMALMVYSHSHRRDMQRAQRVIGLLTSDVEGADSREDAALRLCQTGSATPNNLASTFARAVENHGRDRRHFADTMLNPREMSFSIPELAAFLAGSGLEIVSPVSPIHWSPQDCLPPEAHERFMQLPLLERMEIADSLKAPTFWVLVRRVAERAEPRACARNAELFWDLVPMPMALGVLKVHELVVSTVPEPAKVRVEPAGRDGVRLSRSPGASSSFHAIAIELMKRVDGRKTIRQISEEAAAVHAVPLPEIRDTIEGYWRKLIDELSLATPDFTRCTRCPQRSHAAPAAELVQMSITGA
jgi:SAM-dependent methyltransferase